MNLSSQLETILFVASKPLSVKKIAKVLSVQDQDIFEAFSVLSQKYNQSESGVVILENNGELQMVSNSENKLVAENFVKAEISDELTKPQLETLTVVSYCGPITRPELDQIRGVNCSLILRNLMMRGLVKESEEQNSILPKYEVTMEYLRHLGLGSISELPDYDKLHQHEHITKALVMSSEENQGG